MSRPGLTRCTNTACASCSSEEALNIFMWLPRAASDHCLLQYVTCYATKASDSLDFAAQDRAGAYQCAAAGVQDDVSASTARTGDNGGVSGPCHDREVLARRHSVRTHSRRRGDQEEAETKITYPWNTDLAHRMDSHSRCSPAARSTGEGRSAWIQTAKQSERKSVGDR